MNVVKLPLCRPVASIVFVGRNRPGDWIAREQGGIFGGLFVNRTHALKHAVFENSHHPEHIIEESRPIELDIPARFERGLTRCETTTEPHGMRVGIEGASATAALCFRRLGDTIFGQMG